MAPPAKDENNDPPPIDGNRSNSSSRPIDAIEPIQEINARMAECSMSSVVSSLDGDEVNRLVNEVLSPASLIGANDGDDFDAALRDMSIASLQQEAPPDTSDHVVPSAPPPPVHVDSPVISHGRHDPILSQQRQRRPLDDVCDAGPPLDPEPFPPPQYHSARRVERVLCYNNSTQDHFFASNVLIRVSDDNDRSLQNVDRAYWRIPGKETIETRMGHLEKCHVLRRLTKSDDDSASDNEDDANDSQSSSDGEDVVFVLTDECVAIKVNYCERMQRLADHSPHSGENPLVEIAALQMVGVHHPHVLGCVEALYDGEHLSVVLPYCDGGDLHDLVVHNQDKTKTSFGLPEPEARKWFRQLLQGLRYLQEMKICHRDLSPENLIINSNRALIIDLGMCLRVPHPEENGGTRRLINPQGQVGKWPYMSPEVFRNAEGFDGYSIDMWTAGTILFFLLTGTKYEHPYDPIFNAMVQDLGGLLSHWGIHLSPEAIDLMQRLITVDPRHRMTLEEATNHPWVQQEQRQQSDAEWLVI